MSPRPFLLLVAAFAAVSGCQGCLGCKTSPLDNPNTTIPRNCQAAQPLIQPQKLDILFVIDNSNSMQEEQEGVARELTAFIEQLRQAGGVPQDFHLGVVTTTVYQHSNVNGVMWWQEFPGAGLLRPVPDVLPDGGVDLETSNERMLLGDDPQLIEKFTRLVRQGTHGSGQETPFEAVRLALLTEQTNVPLAMGGNGGFLRDGARLLVVDLSDEDDCSETNRPSIVMVGNNPSVADCSVGRNSLTPVSEYHRMFTEDLLDSQGVRRELIWAEIAPVGRSTKQVQAIIDNGQVRNIDCPTSNEDGLRHYQMAQMFDPSLDNLDSICRDSFRDTLIHIADLASVNQTLEIQNVVDPRILQFSIKRADGTSQNCTLLNSGIDVVSLGAAGQTTKVRFQNDCKRRADDQGLEIKLLCAT